MTMPAGTQQLGGTVAPPPQGTPAVQPVAIPPVATPQTTQPPAGGQQPVAQPPAVQPQQTQGETQGQPQGQPGGHVHHLPDSAFRRIKDEAKQKGLEELAQANGYESVDAMQEALKGGGKRKPSQARRRPAVSRKRPAAAAAPADTGNGDGDADAGMASEEYRQVQRDMRLMQKRLDKQSAANVDLSQQVKKSNALNRRFKAERQAAEAEMLVREAAARVGVRDIDYAMRLMTRDLQGKSEKDLAEFSEEGFFSGLREGHPYLFGEVSRPATTGNGAGAAQGSPPNPGAAQQGAAQGGKVDVRTMSQEDYRKHLASRGLNASM